MIEQAWQMVTCKQCGRYYECTPSDDYYNATTLDDGVCEPCLLGGAILHTEVAWERCAECGHEFQFPHLCREHRLCGLCHPPTEHR